ncbi:MAG: hypothetical protein R6U40_10625, partial [Desulfobacterales bacterium]
NPVIQESSFPVFNNSPALSSITNHESCRQADQFFHLDICYKHPRFSTVCCNDLFKTPPRVVSCARPETLRGPGSM